MANPFAAFQQSQQAPAPQPGFAQPGYPQPAPLQNPTVQGFGPPAAPAGFGAPPQFQQPPQGYGAPAPQPGSYGAPAPTGYAPVPAPAPQGFVHNLPSALPPGVVEKGGSDLLISKPGSFLLEYDGHQLSAQSATLFVFFKIKESTEPSYPVGMRVKWLRSFKEAPGHWKWLGDAGHVLALLRALTGFASEAAFKESPAWAQLGTTWEQFVMSVIRGEPVTALTGRIVRDEVTYSYDSKTGQPKFSQRGEPFMNHSFRPAA